MRPNHLIPILWTSLVAIMVGVVPSVSATTSKWYNIEVIVFENQSGSQHPTETWSQFQGYPFMENSQILKPPAGLTGPLTEQDMFVQLPEEELSLREEKEQLQNTQDFNVLLHTAWRQAIDKEDAMIPIRLKGGKVVVSSSFSTEVPNNDTYQIDGTIALGLSRFLHLKTDLVYNQKSPRVKDYPSSSIRSYRLKQKRRMKSNEVHYIDHPLFGVLLKITPIAQSELPSQPSSAPLQESTS